jgi:hypothetical protein
MVVALYIYQENDKHGVKLYKIPALKYARILFQTAHPESKIKKVEVFYSPTKEQLKLLPGLGDEGLEEGISASEEEGRHQGSIGAPKGTPPARQNWGGQKWKWKGRQTGGSGYRSQETNQQRWKVKPKQSALA